MLPRAPKYAYSETTSKIQFHQVFIVTDYRGRISLQPWQSLPASIVYVQKMKKQLKRQMKAHALRNVNRLHRTEYECSVALLSLEI